MLGQATTNVPKCPSAYTRICGNLYTCATVTHANYFLLTSRYLQLDNTGLRQVRIIFNPPKKSNFENRFSDFMSPHIQELFFFPLKDTV